MQRLTGARASGTKDPNLGLADGDVDTRPVHHDGARRRARGRGDAGAGHARTAARAVATMTVLALGVSGCGAADSLAQGEDSSPSSTAGATPSASGAAASPSPSEPLGTGSLTGPFGSGSYGHLKITLTEVTVSPLEPRDWERNGTVDGADTASGTPSGTPSGTAFDTGSGTASPTASAGPAYLYTKLKLVNEDDNDDLTFDDKRLRLLVDGSPIAGDRVNRDGDYSPTVASTSTTTREYGFLLDPGPGSLTLADLQLWYGPGRVPVTIPFRPDETEPDYPIPVTPPADVTFSGAIESGCEVPWTLSVEDATLTLDAPARLRGARDNRARDGNRWLVLEATMTTGTPKGCLTGTGHFGRETVRLILDGDPLEPNVSPNTNLAPGQSYSTILMWQVPVGATQAALRGLGHQGSSTAEESFALPEMPLLPGEQE